MEFLNYCRLHNITMQCWPLFQGTKGMIPDENVYPKLNQALAEMAEKYQISKTAISVAWLLRHPAKLQTVTGAMNLEHLQEYVKGMDDSLDRDAWYKLWMAAGNQTRA